MRRFVRFEDANGPMLMAIDADEITVISEATMKDPNAVGDTANLVMAPGIVAITLRDRPNAIFVKGTLAGALAIVNGDS